MSSRHVFLGATLLFIIGACSVNVFKLADLRADDENTFSNPQKARRLLE